MCGLGAFIKTIEIMQREQVISQLWHYGEKLINLINELAKAAGIGDYVKAGGIPCSPWYMTYNTKKEISLPFRTLFSQEMIKKGVLMPWIALCYRHGEHELNKTAIALEHAFKIYAQALEQGSTDGYLQGDVIKPVFRSFN